LILKHINDIAAICAGHGVKTAIISPGSRSAPLTLAFARHPDIETKVIPDERSAAFVALGMAQIQQKPVVLVCTSGSAAYNYAPAVAEAYYQQVPLLVLTADRPPEWIDQYDGQTIRQSGIYGKHVKASFDYPDNPTHADIQWHANRQVNEALIKTSSAPMGPVHINVPLREPFYPETDEKTFFRKVRLIEPTAPILGIKEEDWEGLSNTWKQCTNRLIIGGQQEVDDDVSQSLNAFAEATNTPVIGDVISNLHDIDLVIEHQDAFLAPGLDQQNADLQPELLITFGKSNISKNLKRFIRKYKPAVHWHIQPHDWYQDTFQSLTRLIKMHPAGFFSGLLERVNNHSSDSAYQTAWIEKDNLANRAISGFFGNQPFGEFQAVHCALNQLPEHGHLHLANSMSVRYVNFLGLAEKQNVEVWCNRGTSGIDGSNSTAVGAALAQGKMVTLITGDMAFFYDRNAFWQNEKLPNLRIIVLNNHAGGIFRLIKGPSDQPELEEFFETEQRLDAHHLANEFDLGYQKAENLTELNDCLASFYTPGEKPKILEVMTDSKVNAEVFANFKSLMGQYFS